VTVQIIPSEYSPQLIHVCARCRLSKRLQHATAVSLIIKVVSFDAEVGVLVLRLQAAEAAVVEGGAKYKSLRAGMQDMEDQNAQLMAQLQECEREVSEVTDRYRHVLH